MKALVKAERAPGIWLQEIPDPKLGANDVRIRIRKTAICGTDMHIYSWDAWAQKTIPVPMAVGHEYSGEIVEIGSEATSRAVTAATAARAGATCAATPWASASTGPAVSRSTWSSRRSTPSSCPTRSATRSPRYSILSAMRHTPRSPSTLWARTC